MHPGGKRTAKTADFWLGGVLPVIECVLLIDMQNRPVKCPASAAIIGIAFSARVLFANPCMLYVDSMKSV